MIIQWNSSIEDHSVYECYNKREFYKWEWMNNVSYVQKIIFVIEETTNLKLNVDNTCTYCSIILSACHFVQDL